MNPTTMALVVQQAVLFWIVSSIYFSTTPTNAFSSLNASRQRGRIPLTRCLPSTTRLHTAIQPEQLTPTLTLDVKSLDEKLQKCQTARQAKNVLREELGKKKEKNCSLYGSISIPPGASVREISDADLAIQTRLTNKKYKIKDLIELNGNRDSDRASLAVLCLTIACSTSAITANQSLGGLGVPEILRFVIVWLLSFAPLLFVGYGIATPEKLQTLLVSIQRELFPAYRQRMIQHEAGHLLLGHLLGWPIAGYRANAVKNAVEFYPLQDSGKGEDLARQLGFDKLSSVATRRSSSQKQQQVPFQPSESPFFSEQGRGAEILAKQSVFREKPKDDRDNPFLKLASRNEPTNAWPYRGFDDETLDQLAVISIAGVCAEILALGNAEGGVADMDQLRQIFAAADSEISTREADNRVRFALAYTMSQLRRHLEVLDKVASVMERGGSLAECIVAMEEYKSLSGATVVMNSGDYELRRRQDFRSNKVGWIERIFLGDEKTADTGRDRLVDGKGGGYRKEKRFQLTGDDALYAALAVSLAFLAWASAGGLSLH
jgi:hypothetical protein